MSGSPAHRDLANYNPARGDFDLEPDNKAEVDVARVSEEVLEDEDDDDLASRLEWAVLRIYNSRLTRRSRRKRIVKEHSLIHKGKVAVAESRCCSPCRHVQCPTVVMCYVFNPGTATCPTGAVPTIGCSCSIRSPAPTTSTTC